MLVNSINSSNSGKVSESQNRVATKSVKLAPPMLSNPCDTVAIKKAPSTMGHSVRSAIAGVFLGLAAVFGSTACTSASDPKPDPITAEKVLLNIAKTIDPTGAAGLKEINALSFEVEEGGDVASMYLKFGHEKDNQIATDYIVPLQVEGAAPSSIDFPGTSTLTNDGGIIYDANVFAPNDLKFKVVNDSVQVEVIDKATNAVSDTLLLTKGAAVDTAVLKDVADSSKFSNVSKIAFNDAAKLITDIVVKSAKSIK